MSFFRVASSFLAGILIVTMALMPLIPNLALAQQASGEEVENTAMACADAERDAEADTNKAVYFVLGCLAPLITYLIVVSQRTQPPATRLVGKSAEYVAVYSDCYASKAESIKKNAALAGCLVSTACWVVYVIVVIAAAAEDT